MSRADDESKIFALVPPDSLGRNALEQPMSIAFETLEVLRPRIACECQYKDCSIAIAQERLYRVPAHIGIDGDRVSVELFKGGYRIALGRGPNVAALGVEDDRHATVMDI